MKLDDIDLMNPEMFLRGEHLAAFRIMRSEAPVYWHERTPGQGFWCVTRYEDALKVYHDPYTYSSEFGMSLQFNFNADSGSQAAFGMMLLTTDPPRHGKLRQIVNRRFAPRALALYQARIRARAEEIIDAVIERGECDFVVDVAAKLPTAVICEMMGVDREHHPLMFTLANMSIGFEDPEYQQGRGAIETGQYAQARFFEFFSKLIEQRRKNPGEDLLTALVYGEAEGERLSDMEILFNCLLLLVAGQETTRNATSGGIQALLESPAQRALLRRSPDLTPAAIEEFLRYTSPVTHVLRTAKKDGELRGHMIKQGERVVIWNASANRDEAIFRNPDAFDLARTPNDHLAFGHGEHFCLGANLARIELKAMIEAINRRMPDLELAGPVERLRSNFVAGIKHMPVRFTPSRASAGSSAVAQSATK
ncbi:MAG TPA: cytochrome P450 [Candidatus Binataceae bacterium]|nr:cytochrome P450 [Candidatus Binataceae bacterium]